MYTKALLGKIGWGGGGVVKKDGSALIGLNSVYSRKSTFSKGCWVAWGFFSGFLFKF